MRVRLAAIYYKGCYSSIDEEDFIKKIIFSDIFYHLVDFSIGNIQKKYFFIFSLICSRTFQIVVVNSVSPKMICHSIVIKVNAILTISMYLQCKISDMYREHNLNIIFICKYIHLECLRNNVTRS